MVSQIPGTGQIARRGEAIYQERVHPLIGELAKGSFVVIDVESGDYEIGAEDVSTTQQLLDRYPDAITYAVRVGYPAAYSLGGGLSPSDK